MSSLSVIIPVFNAEGSLKKLCEQLIPVVEPIVLNFEILLVDDGSVDQSWKVISELQSSIQNVRGIKLSRNYGQHNALLCGIRAAKFEMVITMDDDLQNPVSEIPKLLDKLNEGYDVVYGTPDIQQHGIFRNLASRLTKTALQSVMGAQTASNVSAFRIFKTRLRKGFNNYNSSHVSIDVLLTWSTANFASIKVKHLPRELGESNYTVRKLVVHAFNLATGFSTLPLQLASFIGFLFTIFGIGVLGWVVGRFLIFGSSMPGFTFLASIIAIFSGVQLFALGIFGEYLARIHFRTMDRPPYVISKAPKVEEET